MLGAVVVGGVATAAVMGVAWTGGDAAGKEEH